MKAPTPEAIAKRIVAERRCGNSFPRIAQALEEEAIPAPGGGQRWYCQAVQNIYERVMEVGTASRSSFPRRVTFSLSCGCRRTYALPHPALGDNLYCAPCEQPVTVDGRLP
jgi:hypothetical protein